MAYQLNSKATGILCVGGLAAKNEKEGKQEKIKWISGTEPDAE